MASNWTMWLEALATSNPEYSVRYGVALFRAVTDPVFARGSCEVKKTKHGVKLRGGACGGANSPAPPAPGLNLGGGEQPMASSDHRSQNVFAVRPLIRALHAAIGFPPFRPR